jgi:hypothetical protein
MINQLYKYECVTGSMESITNEFNNIKKYCSNITYFNSITGLDQFQRPVISLIFRIDFIDENCLKHYEEYKKGLNNKNNITGIN